MSLVCIGLQHTFNLDKARDYHQQPKANIKWHQCKSQLCPQRYQKILKPTSIRKPYTTPVTSQEKLITATFTSQKFETPIPANQTLVGSPVIPTSQIPSTSSATNLPKLDIPEPEPETKSASDNEEERVKQIITEEPVTDKSVSMLPRPEFKAEYRFTHRGVTYQGYLNLLKEDAEANYQKEIDTHIPGLKGDELQVVKAAFVDSLHFYPKKDWEKFL